MIVNWTCEKCGHEHWWNWPASDCGTGPISMRCDRCDRLTRGELVWEQRELKFEAHS